jgi:excisionase family DNA binding protein
MNVMERLAGLPPMITVEEASKLLGVRRSAGYRAAAIGQIPTLRVGRKLRVPTAWLLRVLAVVEPDDAGAEAESA